MSTYNFEELTDCNLIDKYNDIVINMSQCYLRKKKLGIGESYNKQDFLIMDSISKILCAGKCTFEVDNRKIQEIFRTLTLKYK